MGCDFSHCDLRMSYGGFACLCERLAKEAGIDLSAMTTYGGKTSWDEIDDPLAALFTGFTSDGGTIPASKCLPLKRRIEELALNWPQEEYKSGIKTIGREAAFAIAHAIAKAAFSGEPFYWF